MLRGKLFGVTATMEPLDRLHQYAVAELLVPRNECREPITFGIDTLYCTPVVILVQLFDVGLYAHMSNSTRAD